VAVWSRRAEDRGVELRYLVLVAAAGCGNLLGITDLDGPVDAAAVPQVDAAVPLTWTGLQMQTMPSTFGGTPYCMYTITLDELELDLDLLPDGTPTSGHVQDVNVEAVVVSTTPDCPSTTGVIPPNTATYTLQPATSKTHLTFAGATTNDPLADLIVDLTPLDAGTLDAQLTFHRSDQMPPLDWTVITTITLARR
jgi:hypothetical protein